MNKKEIAKVEKMLRELGYNEKQIKIIIKEIKKHKFTYENLLLILRWGVTCGIAVALAKDVEPSKTKKPKKVIR
jgi:hypothetical protein